MSKDAPGRLGRLVQRIDSDPRLVKLLRLGRSRWRFSAKGAPKGLKVYAAEPS